MLFVGHGQALANVRAFQGVLFLVVHQLLLALVHRSVYQEAGLPQRFQDIDQVEFLRYLSAPVLSSSILPGGHRAVPSSLPALPTAAQSTYEFTRVEEHHFEVVI